MENIKIFFSNGINNYDYHKNAFNLKDYFEFSFQNRTINFQTILEEMLKLLTNSNKLKIDHTPRKKLKKSISNSRQKKINSSQANIKIIKAVQQQNNIKYYQSKNQLNQNKIGGLLQRQKAYSNQPINKMIQHCFDSQEVSIIIEKLLKKKILTISVSDTGKFTISKKSLSLILQQALKSNKKSIQIPLSKKSIISKQSIKQDSSSLIQNNKQLSSRKTVYSQQQHKSSKEVQIKKNENSMPKMAVQKRRLSTFSKQKQFKGNRQDGKSSELLNKRTSVLFKKIVIEQKISSNNQLKRNYLENKIKLIDENFDFFKNKQLAESLSKSIEALDEILKRIEQQYYQQSEEIIAIFNKIIRNLVAMIKSQKKQVDIQENILNKYMAKLYDLKSHFVAYWSEVKKKTESISQIIKTEDNTNQITKIQLIFKQILQMDKISARFSQYLPV